MYVLAPDATMVALEPAQSALGPAIVITGEGITEKQPIVEFVQPNVLVPETV